jgi:hypothetical protein
MSPIMVGGDDSVIWKVRVKRARHASSEPDHQGNPKDFYHEGVDENGPDEMLKVTVRLPAGDPLPTLQNFPSGQATQVGGRVWLTVWLPIEMNNGIKGRNERDPDQVSIDWTRKTAQ